ncbi:oligopeptide ABC transporter ATP-binding protein [Candidatus Acetothermia bacterium]|nr:MAG: oligopeptide ABC transporter ATP-binding protein [Candidatus Acetothermia bacterium]RLE35361.1 MAG: oligopeptide ABC transporter ATP-binding protein [Candidatus Acetothermia bacterium]
MQDQVLLRVRDLHKWFELRKWGFIHVGFVRAVDGVDFDIQYGEAVTFVGESGCGKSTLARTILGLYQPTKGEIFFEGKRLQRLGRWYRSQVGYIQQDPYGALPPFMNVRRILLEPMVVNRWGTRAERERRIREVLEEVKLTPVEDFIGKFPHMLSGGQQQRLVIARSIVLNPKFLVADEPVSMLDASVRVEILQLLQGVQEAHNLGVAYITHDLSTVRYFSERIFVMYAAKLVEKAPVKELIHNPLHPYTRALLDAIPDPDPENAFKFKEVPPGEPPSLLNPPLGCRYHPRCKDKIEGLCDREIPPEFEPVPNHYVSCWLYK